MKFKLLIVLLGIAVIALGVLFGMKIMQEQETPVENIGMENSIQAEEPEEELPKSKYDGSRRTLAVVIDNVGDAVPQASLNDAMIVYEAIVEGGLTRFLAIYKDPQVETIGPARSARPYFIDYALENDSIFIHYGGSPRALEDVKKLNMENINGIESPGKVFWRTNKKAAPHNAMVSVEEVWKYTIAKNYRTTTTERNVLNYTTKEVNLESLVAKSNKNENTTQNEINVTEGEVTSDENNAESNIANSISIPYPTQTVSFRYNEETKLYERYVKNVLQKDFLTGEPLTTKNIIITMCDNYTLTEASVSCDKGQNAKIETLSNTQSKVPFLLLSLNFSVISKFLLALTSNVI